MTTPPPRSLPRRRALQAGAALVAARLLPAGAASMDDLARRPRAHRIPCRPDGAVRAPFARHPAPRRQRQRVPLRIAMQGPFAAGAELRTVRLYSETNPVPLMARFDFAVPPRESRSTRASASPARSGSSRSPSSPTAISMRRSPTSRSPSPPAWTAPDGLRAHPVPPSVKRGEAIEVRDLDPPSDGDRLSRRRRRPNDRPQHAPRLVVPLRDADRLPGESRLGHRRESLPALLRHGAPTSGELTVFEWVDDAGERGTRRATSTSHERVARADRAGRRRWSRCPRCCGGAAAGAADTPRSGISVRAPRTSARCRPTTSPIPACCGSSAAPRSGAPRRQRAGLPADATTAVSMKGVAARHPRGARDGGSRRRSRGPHQRVPRRASARCRRWRANPRTCWRSPRSSPRSRAALPIAVDVDGPARPAFSSARRRSTPSGAAR